jgi:hypothetical protein
MIGDIACLGICIVDPETGICQGCGRGPEEISAPAVAGGNGSSVGVLAGHHKPESTPLSAVQYPLPPQVARQLQNPSD